MTDIHSHVLPLVDDGSNFYEKSFEMLEHAKKLGVDKMVLTPHYKKGVYDLPAQKIIERYKDFCEKVKERGIEIKLYLGQEIAFSPSFYEQLKSGEYLTLNGEKFVLIEFDYFEPCDISDCVYNVKAMGYTPVIAHVERYLYLSNQNVIELKNEGALIQVNSISVTGRHGRKLKKKALSLIKLGLVDFIASDVHYGRKNDLDLGYKIIKHRFGKAVADDLFENNAKIFNL